VTEIEVTNDSVIWHRIGVDETPLEDSNPIGGNVSWYKEIGLFRFDKKSYTDCIYKLNSEEW
jgi:hypothetical protein